MSRASRKISVCVTVAAVLGLCAAGPIAPETAGPAHRSRHHALPSTLPPPHYVGDPATRLLRRYGGTKISVTTYHYDQGRTGWNPTETDLTPATVASPQFGLLATLQVQGNVLAQPLLLTNVTLPDKSVHDLLIIATGHDIVYAFDAQTYALLWQVSLGTSQSFSDVGCTDVLPEYGISSTPVVIGSLPAGRSIYVVAATEPSPDTFVASLHKLNPANGKDRLTPTVISASATLDDNSTVIFDQQNQWNRAGLAEANNSIYIGIGSHCDNNSGNITGWLLRYSSTLQQTGAFHTVETHGGAIELASIWMSGFAPAINNGYIYFSTGNGNFTSGAQDWGDSILRMNATLSTVESSFTDANNAYLEYTDGDLGSGGVMLLPKVTGQKAPPLAVQMGKPGSLYLLNQNKLGGLTANNSGALQVQTGVANPGSGINDDWGGVWGGPAYYDGAQGPTVFTQGDTDVLKAWSVNTGAKPKLTLTASGTSVSGYGGSMPIVSSNGSTPETGIVWLINRAEEPFSVEAYDATKLGAPIFSAQVGYWSNLAEDNPFLTPMEANGRVYVPGANVVQVYGLTP